MKLIRTNEKDTDFISLNEQIDKYFYTLYGNLQKKYAPCNIIKNTDSVFVGYKDNKAMACGCFREFDEISVEMKRMYVSKEYRKRGYAKTILNSLELLAKQMGYKRAVLETGIKQIDAIALYKKQGYKLIEKYGIYKELDTSICMEKLL